MKAAVLERPGVIVYKEVKRPQPGPGEALMAVKAASICGSDILRTFHGAAKMYPLILGHEGAGIIVEVGQEVEPSLIGKRVAIAPLIPCMKCPACQRNVYSACSQYGFIGSRQHGCFAQYMVAPAQNLIQVPDSVDFEVASILEPATVALHGLERAGMQAGQRVAIFGVGSVGLCAVQWARIKSASQIIAVDLIDENLGIARSLGAHETLNPTREDIVEQVMALTGDGVDIAVEVAGAPKALQQAVAVTRPRGIILCVGNLPTDARLPSSLVEHIIRQELSMMGTWMSYSQPFPGHEWSYTLAATLKGDLQIKNMISHRFPLSETNGVFQRIAAHTLVHRKIILQP
jgi:L-iditol 2-dehydrogenase